MPTNSEVLEDGAYVNLIRSRNNKLSYTIRRIYHRFYKKDDELKYEKIPWNLYRKIIESIFVKIFSTMVLDKWVFKPPNNIGIFMICESDLQMTRNRTLDKYNTHSGGIGFFVRWVRQIANTSKIYPYNFKTYKGPRLESGAIFLSKHIKDSYRNPKKEDYRANIKMRYDY